MAALASPPRTATIQGECTLAGRTFSVDIVRLTSDGCEAELSVAEGPGWDHDCDFCTLSIAGQVVTNGRVARLGGGRARIAFFGHIHPVAVEKLIASAS